MQIGKTLRLTMAADWHEWLSRHAARESEIWLVLGKKGAPQSLIAYESAVEEALCFGWIDSQIKGIDQHYYAQRFSPRRPGSKWSASNLARMERLAAAGRITREQLQEHNR